MKLRTEIMHYRVRAYSMPTESYIARRWRKKWDQFKSELPSTGKGVPKVRPTNKDNITTWVWTDGFGRRQKVVATKLKRPVTMTYEYEDIIF